MQASDRGDVFWTTIDVLIMQGTGRQQTYTCRQLRSD